MWSYPSIWSVWSCLEALFTANLIKTPSGSSQIAPNVDPTSALNFFIIYNSSASGVRIWGYLEGPWWWFYQIRGKKSFTTRPNTPYGGETSRYSLLQGGVANSSTPINVLYLHTGGRVQNCKLLDLDKVFFRIQPHTLFCVYRGKVLWILNVNNDLPNV